MAVALFEIPKRLVWSSLSLLASSNQKLHLSTLPLWHFLCFLSLLGMQATARSGNLRAVVRTLHAADSMSSCTSRIFSLYSFRHASNSMQEQLHTCHVLLWLPEPTQLLDTIAPSTKQRLR